MSNIREGRIRTLVRFMVNRREKLLPTTFDDLLKEARKEWPFMRRNTLDSYARSALDVWRNEHGYHSNRLD